MKKKFRIFLFVFVLTIYYKKINSQTYDFRNYSLEEGLPQSQVLALCQDYNGNIWMGTNGGGIGKFDGSNFDNLTENEGLANNVVYSIFLMKNGNILIGTNGGLSVFNGKKFINYTEKEGLPNNRVYKAVQDKNGVIWIGTPKGVCTLQNNHLTPFLKDTLLNNSSVWTIFFDREKNIWFGTLENGVIKYSTTSGLFSYYNSKNVLNENFIWSINEDSKGDIYIGTRSSLNKVNKSGVFEKNIITSEKELGFYSILNDNDNNIWFSTNDGVYKYKSNVHKKFSIENGLPSNIILSSLVDREGNLWFGTSGCGVTKLVNEAFISYNSSNKLPSDHIASIFQDSKMNIWLGVTQYGVVKYDKHSFINYKTGKFNTKNSIIDDEVQAICEGNNGDLFFGTKYGLSIFNGEKFNNYTLENNNIYSIIKDSKNRICIGTKDGLFFYNDSKITPAQINISELSKDEELNIYSIAEDKNHNLWLATEKGVIRYTGKSALLFSKKSGFTSKRVNAITSDKNNNLWFGTDEGIFVYDYSQFYNIDETSGLSSNKVYLLLLDNSNLWIGTNKGLDKLDLLNFYSKKKIAIKHYGKEEGFKGLECNRNATFKDADGNLWFGTIKGATIFSPTLEKVNLQEPTTQLTGIRLFFENAEKELTDYSDSLNTNNNLPINLILPHDKNHITFDFVGICMTNPTKVKYQFKLEGADNDWFPPTSKTEATYSSLAPGEYTFYLKAMNNDGLWNRVPISYSFTILPPWWKTWWFYTLLIIILFGCVYLFINIRTKNLTKAKIKLEQEVQLRTNQLREEKEKVEIINKEVITQKAIIEAKNQDITDSIKYAKNIQEAILPPLNSLYHEFKDVFIIYQPKDIVSGDFYWFNKRNNKRLIAAVDCTGHGVPGAFMSIVGNTLLNEIVSEKNITEPAKILNELHLGVKEALKQNDGAYERQDGMDIALCALNEDNTLLEFSGANRPLWIFRNNAKNSEEAFEQIKPNKFPIGGIDSDTKRTFTNNTVTINKGDIIYLFSDGFADQFGGEKGKKFMVGNLQKKLISIQHLSIKEQEKELLITFNKWKGNLEQVDDVLVIAFRI